MRDRARDGAGIRETARAQHDSPRAQIRDSGHVVAHEHDRAAAVRHGTHLPKALALKVQVAHRQDFVDDQNLAPQMRGHGKGEPHVHPAAVMLHGRIEKAIDAGEGDDGVELLANLGAPHAEDGAVEEDVLATSQLLIESGADFQKAPHAAIEIHFAMSHLRDPGQNLQQRAFSGAVSADEAEHFAASNVEGDVPKRPEVLARRPCQRMTHAPHNGLGKRRRRGVVVTDGVLLPHSADRHRDVVR